MFLNLCTRLAKNFKEKIGMLNRDKLNEVINKIREKDSEISSLIKNRDALLHKSETKIKIFNIQNRYTLFYE